MRAPLDQIFSDADALSAAMGRLRAPAGPASSAHPGSAGRRRAGAGESFWQYRRFRHDDSADRIDWRRSARGDKLYVRETELETARTFLFWIDPSPGFHWGSEEAVTNKASRAAVIFTALADALARAGERVGALGGARSPSTGRGAAQRMIEDLWDLPDDAVLPVPGREPANVFIASDFYAPMTSWTEGLSRLADRYHRGALLAVADPAETDWKFDGRVRMKAPGLSLERLIGRAESVRDLYLKRFQQRRDDMDELARKLGWACVSATSSDDARTAAAALADHVQDIAVS